MAVRSPDQLPHGVIGHPLLAEPPDAGWFRKCPQCGRRFGLKLVRKERDQQKGVLALYRCANCEATIEFAERHPPKAI